MSMEDEDEVVKDEEEEEEDDSELLIESEIEQPDLENHEQPKVESSVKEEAVEGVPAAPAAGGGTTADAKPIMKKQSGYVFFGAENRASVVAEIAADVEAAALTGKERSQMVMRRLAGRWATLTAAEKDGFAKNAPVVESKPRKKKNPKDEDDDDGPKMAKQSGYIFFSNEHREAVKTGLDDAIPKAEKNKMVMKKLGEMWSILNEDEKRDWTVRAPMIEKKKRKAPKPVVPAPSTKPVVGVLSTDQMKALRELKSLHDDGILDSTEFAQQKSIVLQNPAAAQGQPKKKKRPSSSSSSASSANNVVAEPAPLPPSEVVSSRNTLPVAAVEPYLDDTCECAQTNPKRPETASFNRYEIYKEGTTPRMCHTLGANKSDVAHDIMKGFITLIDSEKHAELMTHVVPQSSRGPTNKKRDSGELEEEATEDADGVPKKIVALELLQGSYYVSRIRNTSPHLGHSIQGPVSYKKATGALVIKVGGDSPEGVGSIMMKGVTNPMTEKIFVPKMLAPRSLTSSDGTFKFRLVETSDLGIKGSATGELEVHVTGFLDVHHKPILQGTFKFDSNLPEFSSQSSWIEQIRLFKADIVQDTEWPDEPRLT